MEDRPFELMADSIVRDVGRPAVLALRLPAIDLTVFGLAMVCYLILFHEKSGSIEHVMQAWAFLHGHTYVDAFGAHEHVVVAGHSYLLHPLLPALVMVPFVALWGITANQTLVCIVTAAISVMLCYRLTKDPWLTAFYALGTPFAFEAVRGSSWGFCLVLSTVPTWLALHHCGAIGRQSSMSRGVGTDVISAPRNGRIFLVGLFAGLAALARYDLFLVAPLYLVYAMFQNQNFKGQPSPEYSQQKSGRIVFVHFLPGLLPAILAYVAYAYIRFGTLTDHTLWLWYAIDGYRAPHVGAVPSPFSIHYIGWNLYTALFMAPGYTPSFPYIRPWYMGMALTLTSPALVLALRSPLREAQTWLLWACTGLGMAAALTVYSNGQAQFGARYWIQVLPFLLVLMHRGGKVDQLGKFLVLWSILVCTFGTWVVQHYGMVS